MHRTARGLQYSGPVITLRVQYGQQIQYNTIPQMQVLSLDDHGVQFVLALAYTCVCIVLYLLPVLNPKSYDEARVLEASGRPIWPILGIP